MDDVLVTVLSSPRTSDISPVSFSPSIARGVSRSVREIFLTYAPFLLHDYQARLELLNVVARAVSTQCRHNRLVMFGSSANFIFRPDSDLDLCVVSSQNGENRTNLVQIQTLERLEPTLRRSFGGVRLVRDAKVPVIRIGKLRAPMGSRNRLKLSCDISADLNGFIKTSVLVFYYKRYPWLLPLIRFIIQWARVSGFIQKLDGVLINTNVLVFMILSFCVQKSYIMPCPIQDIVNSLSQRNEDPEFFEAIINSLKNERPGRSSRLRTANRTGLSREMGVDPCLGEILLEFFHSRREILSGSIPETFRDLLGKTTFSELLTPEDVETLREQMQKAYHVLVIHGNGYTLLDISSAQVCYYHLRIFRNSNLSALTQLCWPSYPKSSIAIQRRPKYQSWKAENSSMNKISI